MFNNVVIKPYQDLIIDALDELFAVNNISLNLYFTTIEPLEFMEIDDDLDAETVEEETGIKQEDEATIIDEYRSQLNSDNKKCCFSETQGKDYEVAQALIELGEDVDSELWEPIVLSQTPSPHQELLYISFAIFYLFYNTQPPKSAV